MRRSRKARPAIRVAEGSDVWHRRVKLALAALLVAAWLCGSAAIARADVLETKSGVQYKGKLIERTPERIVFQLGEGNLTVRRVFKPSEVHQIVTEDAPAGEGANASVQASTQPAAGAAAPKIPAVRPAGKIYYVIPLEGMVGIYMTQELVENSLAHAAELKPDVVVFEINSPGGFVAEMLPIMDLIMGWQREHPTQRVVALVQEEALSAAAITAMGVKEIYMMPGSSIGAAMVIAAGDDGRYERVNEKVESALRAKARSAAEFGGHNPLIIEAMMAPSVEISLAKDAEGKPVVLRGAPATHQANPAYKDVASLDGPESLLTLTPAEAERCGLIAGIVNNEAELMSKLGLEGAKEFDSFGRDAQAAHAEKINRITREFERLSTLIRKRQASGVLGGTYAAMVAQRNELRGIKTSITSIQKQSEKHAFMGQYIEGTYGASFEGILQSVEEQLAWVEDQLSKVQRSRGR